MQMAPIICRKTRVVYFPAPKNGSSALRALFFELENGFPFRPFSINGKHRNLFWLYGHAEYFKQVPIPESFAKFTVVRHPIERFISCYKFFVLEKKLPGAQHTPELDEFVEDLETFSSSSSTLRFHLTAQLKFLGTELAYYDKVFKLESLDELSTYLSNRSGAQIKIPASNVSREHPIRLSTASIEKLRRIYKADFELLRPFYDGAT